MYLLLLTDEKAGAWGVRRYDCPAHFSPSVGTRVPSVTQAHTGLGAQDGLLASMAVLCFTPIHILPSSSCLKMDFAFVICSLSRQVSQQNLLC